MKRTIPLVIASFWCLAAVFHPQQKFPDKQAVAAARQPKRVVTPTPPAVKAVVPTKTQTVTELRSATVAAFRPVLIDQRPMRTFAWNSPVDPSAWLVRVGHGLEWTQTGEIPGTNRSVTSRFESPWKPYVLNVSARSSTGTESSLYDHVTEVYWNLPTNGIAWKDETGAHFTYGLSPGQTGIVSASQDTFDWRPIATNRTSSNAMITLTRPGGAREFYRLQRL